jgi:hypothetical protein
MQERSHGVTTLAYSSVLIGLYCQFAAIALILTGSVYAPSGEPSAAMALLLGALFFGLTFASYFLGYGFWTRKHWSWAGGIALFVTLVVASAALSIISTDFVSTLMPLAAAVAGIWYLNRPAVKAELLGTEVPEKAPTAVPDSLEGAQPAR